jgi:hypothetical protein
MVQKRPQVKKRKDSFFSIKKKKIENNQKSMIEKERQLLMKSEQNIRST